MRVLFLMLVVIGLLVLALGGLKAIAFRDLPVAKPLPNISVPDTWYWR